MTMIKPIKLRNPRDEGVVGASWLKAEARVSACTAKVCLYFFEARAFNFVGVVDCDGTALLFVPSLGVDGSGEPFGLALLRRASSRCPFDNAVVVAVSAILLLEWLQSCAKLKV